MARPRRRVEAAPPAEPKPFRLPPAGEIALLVVAVVLAFLPVLSGGFVYDDALYVTGEPHVSAGLSLSGIGWAFRTASGGIWDPLTKISHMADVSLFGLAPAGHHATNLLLHAATAILLSVFLRRSGAAPVVAFFGALLWAVHPLRVEAVAWVSSRKDTLSGLFLVLALVLFGEFARNGRRRWYWLALLADALSLLAKPMAVTLPFALLLLDVWPLRRLRPGDGEGVAPPVPLRRAVLETLPFLALSVLSSVVAFAAQRTAGALASASELPLLVRLETAVVGAAAYLDQTLRPIRFAAFYPHPFSHWPAATVFFSALLLAAITAFAILRARKRETAPLVAWLFFLGTLVPVSGIVQFGGASRADRFTYVPQMLLFAGALELLRRIVGPRPLAAGASAAALALALVSRGESAHWRSDATLFRHALVTTKGNHVALQYAGVAAVEEGNLREGERLFRLATGIRPAYGEAWSNLGSALLEQGRTDEALAALGKAVELSPASAAPRANRGGALAQAGRLEEAAAELAEAVRLDPRNADAQRNLGAVSAALGKWEPAARAYRAAVALRPGQRSLLVPLGVALAKSGSAEGAELLLREAAAAPGDADLSRALGMALAALGRRDEAAAAYRRALELRPGFSEAAAELAALGSAR